MANIPLTKDSEFIVGENKVLDYVVTILFFGLFIFGLINAIANNYTSIYYIGMMILFLLGPGIFFLIKANNKRIYIRINKRGIYQDEKLLTDWPHFLKAYLSQKQKIFTIQDNFILVVEYTKDVEGKGFRRKIPLTNTQNKSEEEVLEAVKFFWKEYVNETGW